MQHESSFDGVVTTPTGAIHLEDVVALVRIAIGTPDDDDKITVRLCLEHGPSGGPLAAVDRAGYANLLSTWCHARGAARERRNRIPADTIAQIAQAVTKAQRDETTLRIARALSALELDQEAAAGVAELLGAMRTSAVTPAAPCEK